MRSLRQEKLALTFRRQANSMSLEKIRDALKKARENQDGFSWVDEEFSDLLILLTEHILKQHDDEWTSIPSGYISVSEFERKYKLVAANTLAKYCKDDDCFRDNCALFVHYQWYVKEQLTLDYLGKKTFFKKRMERLGKSW